MITFFNNIFKRIINSGHERTLVIKKNIILGFVIKGFSIIINLLYVPLLINYLDSERYGIWLALSSFLAWFQFFDIGLGNGLRNRLTEALAKNDLILAKKLVSTSYLILSMIFFFIAFIFLFIGKYIPWNKILNTTIISHHELAVLGIFVFVFMCIRFIVQLIQPILFALQKSALASAFPLFANILSLSTIYILKYSELPNLLSVGFVLSIMPIVSFLIGSFIIFKGRYNYLSPGWNFIDFSYSKSLMKLGANFFLIQIAAVIINSTSNIIIIQLFGANDVTNYNVAFKYFQVVLMLNAILLTPFWSAFTDAFTKKDFDWAKRILKKVNYVSFVLVLCVILMLTLSPIAIKLWVGNRVQISWLLYIALAIYTIEYILIFPYDSIINGSGKLRVSVYLVYVFAALFIILAILLGKTLLGVAGVVFASCIIKAFALIIEVYQSKLILSQKTYGIWSK